MSKGGWNEGIWRIRLAFGYFHNVYVTFAQALAFFRPTGRKTEVLQQQALKNVICDHKLPATRPLENNHEKCDTINMTDFLFARPSILEGIGRNIDLFGILNVYNTSSSGPDADKQALSNDWQAIYGDLHNAYQDTICQLETRKNAV
jgi:hypothetical protein